MSVATFARQYSSLADFSFADRPVSTETIVLRGLFLQGMSWSVFNRLSVDVDMYNGMARLFPRKPHSWVIYDYERMKTSREWMSAEITREIYAPRRIQKWIEAGNELEDFRAYLA